MARKMYGGYEVEYGDITYRQIEGYANRNPRTGGWVIDSKCPWCGGHHQYFEPSGFGYIRESEIYGPVKCRSSKRPYYIAIDAVYLNS